MVVGLRSLFSGQLSAGSNSQLLNATPPFLCIGAPFIDCFIIWELTSSKSVKESLSNSSQLRQGFIYHNINNHSSNISLHSPYSVG